MAGAAVETKFLGKYVLWKAVMLSLLLGVLTGWGLKHFGADASYSNAAKQLGSYFILLIKMVVSPLIFFAILKGITGIPDMTSFKRVGFKGIGAYMMTAVFAVFLGIATATLFQPGMIDIDRDQLKSSNPFAISLSLQCGGQSSIPPAGSAPGDNDRFFSDCRMTANPFGYIRLAQETVGLNCAKRDSNDGESYACTPTSKMLAWQAHDAAFEIETLNCTLTDAATGTLSCTPVKGISLRDLIPENALQAMTGHNYIQVVVFSIFMGIVILLVGKSLNEKAYAALGLSDILRANTTDHTHRLRAEEAVATLMAYFKRNQVEATVSDPKQLLEAAILKGTILETLYLVYSPRMWVLFNRQALTGVSTEDQPFNELMQTLQNWNVLTSTKRVLGKFADFFFKMIELVVSLAPIAVFGFIAWLVSTFGLETLESLVTLVVTVLFACLVQYILFGVMIRVFAGLNPLPFYKKLFTTQIMAFSTSSSKATLTTAMGELQGKLGVSERSVSFLMPLGASINMDGTAIYLGVCAVFFAQMFGVHLEAHHYVTLLITCTLGSIGAAGIPSGSIIFMGMVLSSVGLPLEGIGLLLGVDRILDMVRTTINITGDSAITLIVDKSENGLDEAAYNAPVEKRYA